MYPPNSTRHPRLLKGQAQPALPSSLEKEHQRANSVELENPKISSGNDRTNPTQQRVHKLPQNFPSPPWLKLLLSWQQKSKMIFLTILGLSLISYGYTVHIQDRWKQQHGQLKRLREQEREQIVINEGLKHEMAEVAEQPKSGLVNPQPSQIIFVPAAPPRPPKSPADKNPNSVTMPTPGKQSVGY